MGRLQKASILFAGHSSRYVPFHVGSWVAFFLYRSKRYASAFFLLVGIMAVGFFYVEHFLFLWDRQLKSARFVLSLIKEESGLFFP